MTYRQTLNFYNSLAISGQFYKFMIHIYLKSKSLDTDKLCFNVHISLSGKNESSNYHLSKLLAEGSGHNSSSIPKPFYCGQKILWHIINSSNA